MKRYIVAFLAMCLGGAAAALDLALSASQLAPHQRGVPGQPSGEELQLIFEACITCFGTAYPLGRLLYRWSGAHTEAEELRQWSRGHMALLNIIGGGWLIVSACQAIQRGMAVRPSLFVGLLMAGLGVSEVLRVSWPRWKWRGFMRRLHRVVVVPFGTNILGLLEFFAIIGVFIATITLLSPISRVLANAVLLVAVLGIIVLDLVWRSRQPESSRWSLLFSPFAGGCFLFVPIWLLFPVFILSILAVVLVKAV
jgi:hypothetical protein